MILFTSIYNLEKARTMLYDFLMDSCNLSYDYIYIVQMLVFDLFMSPCYNIWMSSVEKYEEAVDNQ